MNNDRLGSFLVISIIIVSYALFFYFQVTSEFKIRDTALQAGKTEQWTITKLGADAIKLRTDLITSKLGKIANSDSTKMFIIAADSNASNYAYKQLPSLYGDKQISTAITDMRKQVSDLGEVNEIAVVNSKGDIIIELSPRSSSVFYFFPRLTNRSSTDVIDNHTSSEISLTKQPSQLFSQWMKEEEIEQKQEKDIILTKNYKDDQGNNAISIVYPIMLSNSDQSLSSGHAIVNGGIIANLDVNSIANQSIDHLEAEPDIAASPLESITILDADLNYVYPSLRSVQSLDSSSSSSANDTVTTYSESQISQGNKGNDLNPKDINSSDPLPREIRFAEKEHYNNLVRTLVSTKQNNTLAEEVYKIADSERFTTAATIPLQGNSKLFLLITSEVKSFYSKIEQTLFVTRVETLSLLASTSILTIILASFVTRSIKLEKEVNSRTQDLTQSNIIIRAQKEQLEKANKELKVLDELKSEFISIASHELRNPITPIIMTAQMAKRGLMDKEKAIEIIESQAKRLKGLTNDVLDASRLDNDKLILHKENVRIGDLIEEVVKNAEIGNDKRDIAIITKIDENTDVFVDRSRIAQVLSNLLNNALKFTDKGNITVEKRTLLLLPSSQTPPRTKENDRIEIIVSDTGRGIPKEVLPNIFGKFVTKDIEGKNKQGTGLGLFVSKGIITAHKGEITAYNNSSSGATFRIVLPIKNE